MMDPQALLRLREPLVASAEEAEAAGAPRLSRPARVRALDVFRGITICLMIFVNYGGKALRGAWTDRFMVSLVCC